MRKIIVSIYYFEARYTTNIFFLQIECPGQEKSKKTTFPKTPFTVLD